jgi:hypothetical protein
LRLALLNDQASKSKSQHLENEDIHFIESHLVLLEGKKKKGLTGTLSIAPKLIKNID